MVIDLLLQAEFSTRHFSKLRLALPTGSVDMSKRYGYVIEWPRSHQKSLPSEDELQKLRLTTKSYFPSVDYYKCTHDKYKELKTEKNKLDYLRFKILRNYFSIKRLESIPHEFMPLFTISLGTKDTILSEEDLNTNNSTLINNLRMVEDVEWYFNLPSSTHNFELRMPGYYGPLIFLERGLFPDKQLHIVSRPSFGSQRNKDNRALSHLFAISSQDRDAFEEIANFTYNSLIQLVDDKSLFDRCSEILNDFEQKKIGM